MFPFTNEGYELVTKNIVVVLVTDFYWNLMGTTSLTERKTITNNETVYISSTARPDEEQNWDDVKEKGIKMNYGAVAISAANLSHKSISLNIEIE